MPHLIRFVVLQWTILALVISISSSIASENNQSVYEVLRAHGLPMGLLPKGVKEFRIEHETGRFEVHLDQACNAKFESELHYERNVSGTLSYGQIGELSGISAQELFLWFPVKLIRVDVPSSGVIYFDVGVVFKQFSLSLFETPRDCVAVRDEKFLAEAVSKSAESGKIVDPAPVYTKGTVNVFERIRTGALGQGEYRWTNLCPEAKHIDCLV